jgi:5-methylcytosine-specific restriction protein A
MSFEVGQVYNRRDDLHAHYGGQQQGGISTPANHPYIFLFTGASGSEYGYKDEFRPDGTFWYTGEGQVGDMAMTRGNRAIRDHSVNGKELHLFEAIGDGEVRYLGQASYLDHHWEERRDANDNLRRAVVFELAVDPGGEELSDVAEPNAEYIAERLLQEKSLDELRELALQKASPSASASERRTNVRRRSEAIRAYVLKRAKGVCEGCNKEAPFVTFQGWPYLESHHVSRVSDGGPDHPRWAIALCPNCHRRVHHGQNGEEYNARLIRRLGEIESSQDA